jgi:hypothetical protein
MSNMETLGNQLLAIIERFGAMEVRDSLNFALGVSSGPGRNEANVRITEYMKMDGELIDSKKRLVKNVIITSPTQVGKTKYVIDACKRNENRGELIVISCDNSLVQLSQLRSRLTEAAVCNYPVNKATSTVVGKILKSGKTVVLVMLNNASQVGKLTKLINDIRFVNDPTRYIFFHDEADMLNKSDEMEELSNGTIPLSHRSWVGLMDLLENTCIPTNRFWISATPENCSSISRIAGKDILVLPENDEYRPVSGYTHWNIEDDNSMSSLEYEIERIREVGVEMSGEVILYCVDRKNIDQDEMAREISEKYSCVTCSYNMKSMVLYFEGSVVRGIIGKKDNISTVLDKTRLMCGDENAPMVVVGYNLMSRGVSFVAEGLNPPTATVMFYSGGVNSHVVGLAQRFGRITGTARPEISRRMLYCSSGVYDDYMAYIGNQKLVWDALGCSDNSELDICSILLSCEGATALKRPLDRPTLGNVNRDFKQVGVVARSEFEFDADKMHRLVDSWKVESNSTAIARLFREMWNSDGKKMASDLVRERVEDNTENGSFYTNMTSPSRNMYNLVFRKDGRNHFIRDEVVAYLG